MIIDYGHRQFHVYQTEIYTVDFSSMITATKWLHFS